MADQRTIYTIEDKLLMASIAMVENWLMAAWEMYYPDEPKLPVVTVRSADDLRSIDEALDIRDPQTADTKPGIAYPYGNMIITNIGPNPNAAMFNKKHIPVVTARDQESGQIDISNIIPVRMGVGLSIRADDLSHIIKAASILMLAAPEVRLIVESDNGFQYSVKLNIEPELSIPGADMGHPGKEYRFDTTMLVDTYLMRTRTQGVIREIRFGIADATGRNLNDVLRTFDSLNVLLDTRLKYTDIVDRSSTRYRRS